MSIDIEYSYDKKVKVKESFRQRFLKNLYNVVHVSIILILSLLVFLVLPIVFLFVGVWICIQNLWIGIIYFIVYLAVLITLQQELNTD